MPFGTVNGKSPGWLRLRCFAYDMLLHRIAATPWFNYNSCTLRVQKCYMENRSGSTRTSFCASREIAGGLEGN
jgi:hypothetical protein